MRRFTPLAAILFSFLLFGCQTAATKPAGLQSSGGQSLSSPANTASVASNSPAPAVAPSTPNPSQPSNASISQASVVSADHTQLSIVMLVVVLAIGYSLLQVYAGGDINGRRSPAAGFFGHLLTGGSAIIVRLFDNILRFIAAGVTGRSQVPISLVTGNPTPNLIYNPRKTAPAPGTSTATVKTPEAPIAGLGLSPGGNGHLQDIRASSPVAAPVMAKT